MAPTNFVIRDEDAAPTPKAQPKFWTRGTIISFAIFGVLLLTIVGVIVAFLIHKRSERKKRPAEHRKSSYHPFRTQQPPSDKQGLLSSEAITPEEDKSTMFSREKGSAVSLYVDTAVDNQRSSAETISLIPLHITPAEETHDPMGDSVTNNNRTTSYGSSVSALSRNSNRYSSGSGMVLSPIVPNDESDTRRTRPRSTSSASMSTRYYDRTPNDVERVPQLPKIVHTPSP